jgi:ribonuclease P protein component
MQTPHLDIRARASGQPVARVGLIVPRYKHDAVARNRLRRRLRELIRLELLPNLSAGDTLIRAKADAYNVSFSSLRTEIDSVKAWISKLSRQ